MHSMPSSLAADIPIFIICRDKVTPLRKLVEWLEKSGYGRLVLVDNASTYPQLVEYLDQTPHEVVRFSENLGPRRCIWETGLVDRYAKGGFYAVTDSDIVPDKACPADCVDFLLWALRRYPGYVKAGLGLRIDDLPAHYELASEVRRWERRYWFRPLPGGLYHAPTDTTFAVYRPGFDFQLSPSLRSGRPYLARHIPWYTRTADRSEEEQYYRLHVDRSISNWDIQGHQDFETPRMTLVQKVWWRVSLAPATQVDPAVPRSYRPR